MSHMHSSPLASYPDPEKRALRTVAYSPAKLSSGIDLQEVIDTGDLSEADIEIISRPCTDCALWVNDCNVCGTLGEFRDDSKQLASFYAHQAAKQHATKHSDGVV